MRKFPLTHEAAELQALRPKAPTNAECRRGSLLAERISGLRLSAGAKSRPCCVSARHARALRSAATSKC